MPVLLEQPVLEQRSAPVGISRAVRAHWPEGAALALYAVLVAWAIPYHEALGR